MVGIVHNVNRDGGAKRTSLEPWSGVDSEGVTGSVGLGTEFGRRIGCAGGAVSAAAGAGASGDQGGLARAAGRAVGERCATACRGAAWP